MNTKFRLIPIGLLAVVLPALWLLGFTQPAYAQTNEVSYGFVQDADNPLAFTAVAYPNYSSTNVTISTAQFTFLLPAGTAIAPAVPDAPAPGFLTDITGVWQVLKLTPALWGSVGQDPADLDGNDVYQVTLQNSPEVVAVNGDPLPLFSFEIPADCSGGAVRVLTNDNAIQQALLPIVGNINNQMSMSVDDAPSIDIYAGNNPAAAAFGCPLQGGPDGDNDGVPDHVDACPNTPPGEIVGPDGCPYPTDLTVHKTLNTPEPVRPGETISFTISIINSGDTALTVVPLSDSYDPAYLTYVSATPTPSDDELNERDGVILWRDLTAAAPNGTGGDLASNSAVDVTVWFTARRDTALLSGGVTTNTAGVTGAQDANGNTMPRTAADATVQVRARTAAAVSSRRAVRDGDGVTLQWTTSDESAVAAFRLYRTNSDGTEVLLTPDDIVATHAGQSQGSTYSFADGDLAGQSTVHYDLELIAADGSVSRLDLGRVYAGAVTYLPLVTR